MNFQPVATLEELDTLDPCEMIKGYQSGLRHEPEPNESKGKSFWHGWRNGMMDRGYMKSDIASESLARLIVARSREKQ